MKKSFILLSVLAVLGMSSVAAQDDNEQPKALEQLLVYENPGINISVGEIKYEAKTTGQKVQNTVVSALTSADLSVEDESIVPLAKEALTSAVSKAMRFHLLYGEPTAEQMEKTPCLEYTAVITGCNYTNRMRDNSMDKRVLITAFIYLKNIKTGEIVASTQIDGDAWASQFSTIAECNKYAAHNLMVHAINQFNAWYPLRGHMLDKGFQKGKKQKLKEIYIDLGSKNGLGTGYTVNVYTVRRIAGRIARHYIGRGVITEVLGDDISSVALKRGADDIKSAFDNGAEIAVSVN